MIRVCPATTNDVFGAMHLWELYLEENLDDGGTVEPSKYNLDFFLLLVQWYLRDCTVGITMLAWEGQTPIGILIWGAPLMSSLTQAGGRRAIGWGTYVMPQWRKTNVATELRTKAREHLKEFGFTKLDGTVDPRNQAAVKSVEALGFRHTTMNVELDL